MYGTGGVINNIGATIIATDTIFSDNNSGGLGGAITSDGFASFVGCDFIGNTATIGSSGAIFITGVGAFFDKCKFIGNAANTAAGGAIYASAETTVKSTLFKWNSAWVGGAVVHFLNGKLSMDDVEFSANTAAAGGGLGLLASVSDLNNCRFHQNTAWSNGGSGGAIVFADDARWPNNTATLSDTVFQSNLAVNSTSVDIYNSYPSTVACSGNCFCNADNSIDISTNDLPTTCAGDGEGSECPGCSPSADINQLLSLVVNTHFFSNKKIFLRGEFCFCAGRLHFVWIVVSITHMSVCHGALAHNLLFSQSLQH